ncbi:DUF969 domain-containing protein [Streptococcus acidominimus]|uniref:DUF969 domain-containing protein n=1 Tax=Streptococcus acidominimus TaxID=1326 RepID=A0A4Y9FPW3_STRAI|nr:DUF969 domain-containing protein [Streptococcus acidominimus]MBF0818428.1 DUF969 domain-containing protein [Streptococcus acidominimus]MBF0838044.1 DUF969 domain-containing protein [Streptococcus acidominimus]MBF0848520.1 DUF969 domain-containing protein [Streptococcus danieliae]TFU31211.1 DUF969 domain-containing protein [Streptococcus acidominimus]
MEWIKLVGIVIIVLGFVLKCDAIATVVVAGLVTALVSGMSLTEFLSVLGENFTSQRVVTIFLLTLPLVGLAEKYGLRHRAIRMMKSLKSLTAGSFYSLYVLLRLLCGLFSIRLGGHPQFVRPLVEPMGQAAAKAKYGDLTDSEIEELKGRAAASENFGNFFGQNTFSGAAGILLISGTLLSLGYEENKAGLALTSLIIAGVAFLVILISNYLFDKKLQRKHQK